MLCSRRGTLPESPVFFSSCFGGPPMALPAALASPAAVTFTGALGAIALWRITIPAASAAPPACLPPAGGGFGTPAGVFLSAVGAEPPGGPAAGWTALGCAATRADTPPAADLLGIRTTLGGAAVSLEAPSSGIWVASGGPLLSLCWASRRLSSMASLSGFLDTHF